jgi:hypothetical protein
MDALSPQIEAAGDHRHDAIVGLDVRLLYTGICRTSASLPTSRGTATGEVAHARHQEHGTNDHRFHRTLVHRASGTIS